VRVSEQAASHRQNFSRRSFRFAAIPLIAENEAQILQRLRDVQVLVAE
jgi:hypothetical protein